MTSFNGVLCEFCWQVPFNIKVLNRKPSHLPYRWDLGTASRIRKSDCPFCRLASVVLYHTARTTGEPGIKGCSRVSLLWTSYGLASDLGSFQLHCARPSVADIRIGFVGSPLASSVASMDSSVEDLELPVETPGGYLVPNCGEQVDFDRVSTWVAKCVSAHGDFCNIPTHVLSGNAISNHISESYPGLKTFRLIDVDQECIIETTTTCRYVTLSYLWGNAANLRLTTVNFSSLLQPKALQKYTSLVPRTIQDAITFVRAIGERYLWCDALCLVQNDPEDVGNGVKAMDLIYENALLTIVAACGHDANAGLLGVSPGTRLATTETAEVAPGVKLGYYIGLDEYLKRLPYSSRAWT